MKFKASFILFSICIILLSQLHVFAETIKIVAVGDLHELQSNEAGRGGYAKLATIVKESKKDVTRSFFIHAGDAFSPSIIAGLVKGQQAIEHLNAMHLDYFVLGNHEFDFGVDQMNILLEQANFVILAANIRQTDGSNIKKTQDYDIVSVGQFKIAFIGVTREESMTLSSTGLTQFHNVYKTATMLADQVREEGADFVVLISHTVFNEDLKLLHSQKFDLLISGEDHYVLAYDNGKARWIESGKNAEFIAVANIELKKDKKKNTKADVALEVIDTKNIKEDQEIAKISQQYKNRLSKELDIVLTTTKTQLDSRNTQVRSGETVMGNIIADAMKKSVNADIGFTNGGGMRGNKVYPPETKLKKKDILKELPFGNVVVKIEMRGVNLLAALENGVSQAPEFAGRFPQVSGLKFVWDAQSPAGNRVKKVTINGRKLDGNKLYTIATTNYIQNGGDGYHSFKKGKVLINANEAKLLASIVIDYFSNMKNISYSLEGRIIKKELK